jgi:hypothetical protein
MRLYIFKYILNILMAVSLLLLMDPRSFYGLTFHEIAGLGVLLFYVLHVTINWKFVKQVTLRFFTKLPAKPRTNYVFDWLLLIGLFFAIFSGLPIARIIDFSWMGFDRGNTIFWRTMHTSISMIVIIVAGIHLGLHWKWIVGLFKRRRKPGIAPAIRNTIFTILFIAVAIGAYYSYGATNFEQKTVWFFQVAFADEGSRGGFAGRRGGRGRGGKGMHAQIRQDADVSWTGEGRSAVRSQPGSQPESSRFQQSEAQERFEDRDGGQFQREDRGGRRGRGPGRHNESSINLGNVSYYALIMIFCAFATHSVGMILRRKRVPVRGT